MISFTPRSRTRRRALVRSSRNGEARCLVEIEWSAESQAYARIQTVPFIGSQLAAFDFSPSRSAMLDIRRFTSWTLAISRVNIATGML